MPAPAVEKRRSRTEREVATLKALADPTRIQILLELGDGSKTVKEVAAALSVGPTKLYYHFKILERAGLIRVTRRRMVSGIEERTYAATSRTGWSPTPDAAPSLVESGVVGGMLNVVRAEAELALRSESTVPIGEPGSSVPVMLFTRLAMTAQEVERLQRRIQDVTERYTDPGSSTKPMYHAFFTVYGAPSEVVRARGDEEDET